MTTAPIGPHTIQRYRLSNGLTLLVQENHTSPSVVVRGSLRAGALFDPPEKPGLADFTASAMRRGTENRTFAEINETVEAVAASLYVSGGRHLTSFGGKSLVEDFELLVEVLADVLLHPIFPQKEVDKIRGQTLTSLKEMEDSPRALASRYFRELLYTPNHPYGRHVIGTLESIPTITRQHLVDFYQTYYRPEGAIIVVVGDMTGEQVRDALERALGGWRKEGPPSPLEVPPSSSLPEQRCFVHTMADKSQADVIVGFVGPARLASDYYAATLGNVILGQLGLGGRLGENVREEQGLAYYAHSRLDGGLGNGPWLARAGVNPADVEQAIDTIVAELRRFCSEPVSQAELDDAKAYITGTLPLRLETNEGVAGTLHQMELYELGDDYIMRYSDLMNAVSREEILAAAQRYLHPEHYALVVAGPYAAGEPLALE